MSVGSKKDEDTLQPLPSNSYERVIKRVEENPSNIKPKFLPNRLKKDRCIGDKCSSAKEKLKSSKAQHEESAVNPPVYSHEATKLISVEESVKLIQEQRDKAEQIAAERAAQRLAEHFTTQMDTYQPPFVDMGYRHAKADDDDDDDGDDDNGDDHNSGQDSDDIPSEENDDDDDSLVL